MDRQLNHIDTTLARVAQLAGELKADPDRDVSRSITELQAAFATRRAIEPAVARVRGSLTMLRTGNHAGTRREFQRRAPSLEHLLEVVEGELLPDLRRLGFEV
jgi:hypothetical protein